MTRKLFLFIIEITFELQYRQILKAVQTIEDDQTIMNYFHFFLKKFPLRCLKVIVKIKK